MMRAWRNWQTRMVEGHVPTRSGGSNPLARTRRHQSNRSGFHRRERFLFFISKTVLLILAFLLFPGERDAGLYAQELPVSLEKIDDRIIVTIAGERFSEYRYSGFERPILFPVNAAGEVPITRNFPMVADVPGESSDHPHHQSIWFAHGDVNGLDFWSARARIRNEIAEIDGTSIQASQSWLDGDRVVCTEETRIAFRATAKWRLIDFQSTLRAGEQAVTFGDTKEGTFAIRTHAALQIRGEDGSARATAFNSEGIRGAEIWGKKAQWVHYEGEINNRDIGLTMMDAPSNLRHPNLWHARDYGLIAANPFGLHDLGGLPAGSGAVTLAPGQSLRLRYGIVIWNGFVDEKAINELFADFSRE
jgi:Methane oxygenase PmoA